MAKKNKNFESEDQERKYWDETDSSDHFDLAKGKKMRLPKLKPSTKTISLRLPEQLLEEIKIMANKRDVPYQSLIKILLKEKVDSDPAA